jgi:Mn2+/Fe2+ NRAMP family transporter
LVGFMAVALALSIPTAAVLTIVTAGMATQMLAVELGPVAWGIALLVLCIVVLASGGYPLLDRLMKVLMALLGVCTVTAVVAAFGHGRASTAQIDPPSVWTGSGIFFLVALMGWMPTPVDASAWPSLWMQERIRQTGHRPTLGEVLFDFKLGYFGSLAMGLMFLSLGAMVMFGAEQSLAARTDEFAAQFVNMYTSALGAWSRPIVVAAAFVTMFSTLLTVLDGYPRVMTAGCRIAWPNAERIGPVIYWVVMALMAGGALLVYQFLTTVMRTLVDVTTTVAFVSAPLFAYLNYRVMSGGNVPAEMAPPRWLRVLSWLGLVFLGGFTVLFLLVYFGRRA